MPVGTIQIQDPLPHNYVLAGDGVGGIIKERPEDFLVDELPLYEPVGEGEHVYLGVEKFNTSHGEMVSWLKKRLNVPGSAIGYAGMKDKIGVTRQMVSVHTPDDPPNLVSESRKVRVLWAQRHINKLRRGHLQGNRFSIRIRKIDPTLAPSIRRNLMTLAETGVPDYFGYQRFGYRRNTHILGGLWLAGQYDAVLDELLGTKGSPFPDHQRIQRQAYDAGRLNEAAQSWSPRDHAERAAIETYRKTRDAEAACRAISKTALRFWISALQSAGFNRVLDRRIEQQSLAQLLEGDLAWKHDSRAVFKVTPEELAGDELAQRLARFEISPSGPLWGADMIQTTNEPGEIEREALAALGVNESQLDVLGKGNRGTRRPLRVPLQNIEVDSGVDEHGPYVRVAFDLRRGCYATVVLRELMKKEDLER